jgi:hypothetical protein
MGLPGDHVCYDVLGASWLCWLGGGVAAAGDAGDRWPGP